MLGLIFVSFGPLINFPNTNPPISEKIHADKIRKIITFKCRKFEKMKNIAQNENI